MVQPAQGFTTFELRRQSDDLIYVFDRKLRADGSYGYQRRDKDIWIIFRPEWGWVAWDDASNTCTGLPWGILPRDQAGHPPAGDWVSRKGARSYVYTLVYVE